MPELWTRILIDSDCSWHSCWRIADLALTRSQPLPIKITIRDLYGTRKRYRQVVLNALHQISRARELYIHGAQSSNSNAGEDFLTEILQALESHPAPLLEKLTVHCFFLLPRDLLFLGRIPPKLRSVNLWACEPNPVLLQAQLTHLELDEVDLDDILYHLDNLPSLEVLILPAPNLWLLDELEFPPSTLPNLQKLKLSADSADRITRFMPFLGIPPTTSLILSCHGRLTEQTLPTTMESLASVYAHQTSDAAHAGLFYRDLSIRSPEKWGIVGEHNCEISLCNPVPPPSNREDAPALPQELQLYFSWSDTVGEERQLIPRLLTIMPAIDFHQTLTVSGHRLRFMHEWLDIAGHGAHVSQVHVMGIATHGLLLALGQAATPVFPRLTTLSIADVTFSQLVDARPASADFYPHLHLRTMIVEPEDRPELPEEEPIPADSLTMIDTLLAVLASRASSGCPVSHISIRGCVVSADVVESLRVCLGEGAVDWDGRVDGDSDLD
ncbi:hypothetical protein BV25DRAFT_1915789 [Artomyces pyxidatus]|uniref:Uncharacterized protein n=1 Tax=Artomyces pyxidatus TaxID=48021 RepID=A0ACB8T3T1_9AGAM|nr:hypothetical protein BV25DRAFT_1915789 [Artomyces pyxidatus]